MAWVLVAKICPKAQKRTFLLSLDSRGCISAKKKCRLFRLSTSPFLDDSARFRVNEPHLGTGRGYAARGRTEQAETDHAEISLLL